MSKKLVIYLMAGAETPALAAAAVAGGADIIEFGFPFSDPLADGPVIRAAGEKALAAGMRTAACLECLAATRALVGDTPLVPMTYASLLEAYGWERFETDARAAGATSFIIVDTAAGSRPELQARPARRPHLDRRAHRARRLGDRRLALPCHAHRHDRRPHRALGCARRPRRPRPGARRTCRSTPASGSRRRSRRAPRPISPTAIVVGSRAVLVAEEGPAALQEYVASLRTRSTRVRRGEPAPSYFGCTRSPQRSQRWNRSVRKNQLRLRHLVAEELAAQAHASGPTLTSIFPMFSPLSRPSSASGARSSPSTTVSR